MKRLLKHPEQSDIKNSYGEIEDIVALDKYTIQFKHKNPVAEFPRMISYFNSLMFSMASFDENGNIIKPIGTGPFVFEKYIKDDSIILSKNKNYWNGKPKLERVTFKCIPDPNTRLAALESGEVDALSDVGAVMPEHAKVINKNNKLELKQQTVATSHYLQFNKNKIFKDDNLVQAVSLSIDRENIINSILEGPAVPIYHDITLYAVNKKVKNFSMDCSFKPSLDKVEIIN